MKRTLLSTLLIALAATGSAAAADADKAVARHLDKLGYTYEVDEDGDYRMVFDVEGDRTQMVYVRSSVEDFGSHNIREIWSPAYSSKTKQFPVAVANRLLEDSQDAKMGGWVKQDTTAMFVVKIDADATADQLSDAIDAAIRTADAMELELTKKDEF
ncbi:MULTISPECIES: hypothetical protein [Stenotrophomonas]|jgi:hypothetical protein|uniref:YbjN domain-containing protein n=2 Tax=Stenotrophomonas TaxID=40323 RepID=A0AAI9BYY8_STEMA|nr:MULTISPECIES: hypothetical protein [Stenotrophomonas]UUS13581.1 hypothetical protein NMB32_16645 [Stenotrophomonas sp. CD2]AWT14707.1 hypothetical protein DM611_10645 [Stenotrophomonas maltophilia]EKT4091084.1 hypothetical protein [Stenotrophomonas maltophilia]EKT4095365.1 hypothetical protein [Stenotrophomonas maltophilia]ELF4098388.1 hypothetical protein [Stenotrophomonas maltophilia]